MKKNQSKLDEKSKFHAPLKMAFLAPSAPFISKTVRDKKKSAETILKVLIERYPMKKSHQNWDLK